MDKRKLYQGDLQVVSQLSCFVGHSVVLIFREKNHVFSCLDDTKNTDLKKTYPWFSTVQCSTVTFLVEENLSTVISSITSHFFHYYWFPPLLLIFFHHHWFRPLLLIFFHYYWFPPLLLIFFHYYWSSVTAHLLPLLALVNFYNSILIDYILLFFVHYRTFSSITVNACMGFIKSTFFYFHLNLILKKKRIFDILLEILIHDGIILMIYLTNEKVRLHFVCMFNQNIMNP